MSIDEAALKVNLFYNINLDELIGFEDVENGKSFLPACNVAVIMLRGLCKSWKQPIAYFLVNTIFKAEYATRTILQVVEKLQEVGLQLIAVVSDMDNNFVKMAQLLGVVNDEPYFEVNGKKIFYFFDPPHALKASRNMFATNNITIDTKNISWSYMETLYNIDKTIKTTD